MSSIRKVARQGEFGTHANEHWDALHKAVNELIDSVESLGTSTSQTVNTEASAECSMTNTSGVSFAVGDCLGFNSSGTPVKASKSGRFCEGIVSASSGSGSPLSWHNSGQAEVICSGGTIKAGARAWLSTAGQATATAPTSGYKQSLGRFLGTRNSSTGRAMLAIQIDTNPPKQGT